MGGVRSNYLTQALHITNGVTGGVIDKGQIGRATQTEKTDETAHGHWIDRATQREIITQ